MANKPLPSPDELRQLLTYDPGTGKLFWKERPASMFRDGAYNNAASRCRQWNARYAGNEAITADCNGYRYGNISKRSVYAHRIAWAIYHGHHPSGMIDHINGVKHDNRICNLREASAEQNMWNSKPRRGTSQFKGVRFTKGAWQASIMANGETTALGRFSCEIDAARAYDRAAIFLHGPYARINLPDEATLRSLPRPNSGGILDLQQT